MASIRHPNQKPDYGIHEVSRSGFGMSFVSVTDMQSGMGRQPRKRVHRYEESDRSVSIHINGGFMSGILPLFGR